MANSIPDGHTIARANGGHLNHVVNRESYRSLCGHNPKDNTTTRMGRMRAKWMKVESLSPKVISCEKCRAKLARM